MKNLCCLHKCPNGLWLELAKVEELIEKNKVAQKSLEIDIQNRKWRYINQDNYIQSKDWNKIGQESSDEKFVQLVFNLTDFRQLKNAFSIASHFYSSNDNRGSDD